MTTDIVNAAAKKEIVSYIERIERIEDEKKAVLDDLRDLYTEIKSKGLDAKAFRTIVAMRKKDKDKLEEEKAIVDLYLDAIDTA